MRESGDRATLLRSNSLLIEMLDNMISGDGITPETLLNYKENLERCKKANRSIANRDIEEQ